MHERTFTFLILPDLGYLQRGGRIGKAKALIGSMMKIIPIVGLMGDDPDGQMVPLGRGRTFDQVNATIERIIQGKLSELGSPRVKTAVVTDTGADPAALEGIRKILSDSVPCETVVFGGPRLVEAVHLGPGVLTLALDVLKALVPMVLGHYFLSLSPVVLGAIGAGAMFGHKFPLYYGFSGGRAAATLAGVCLFFIPLEIAIAIAVSLPLLFLAKKQKKRLVPLVFFISSVGLSMFLDHPLTDKLVVIGCTLLFFALNADKFRGAEVGAQESEATS